MEKRNTFPPVDKGYKIATALGTSVEYLVTGKDTISDFSHAVSEIVKIYDELSGEGIDIPEKVIGWLKKHHLKFPQFCDIT